MNEELEAQLRAVFQEEARETLDELHAVLSALRQAELALSQSHLSEGMRLAHNLKGAAGNVGLSRVESAAHALEDDLLLLATLEGGPREAHLRKLTEAVAGIERIVEAYSHVARAGVAAPPGTSPGQDAISPEALSGAPRRPASADDDARVVHPSAAKTLRIETEKLDRVLGFASELLVAETADRAHHAALISLYEQLDGGLRQSDERHRKLLAPLRSELSRVVERHRRDLRHFRQVSTELHDAMKRARMVPLARLASSLRRTIDDAARSSHKPVDLEVDVGSVELDKAVLDGLRDPLMHLLRNAVDHGIESPATRDLRGKPERALVQVRADVVGATVRISVADDGRGIDLPLLAESAVRRAMMSAEEARGASEEALLEMIFSAGFSTREHVTRLSGRGVGLDVVRRVVQPLGGSVRAVARGPLGGAAFILTVPLSVLSARVLLVRAADFSYAIPMHIIDRALRVPKRALKTLEGSPVVETEAGEPLRIRWLARMLSGRSPREADPIQLLIVESGGTRVALAVEEILTEEDVVIRKLPWNLRKVEGVSGAAILADGSVAIALDVARLLSPHGSRDAPEVRQAGGVPTILVVDDSMTTRSMHRHVLESAGYQVLLAHDGLEAWEMLRHTHVDAIVSDVQMPRLNGFELTRRIRQDARLSGLIVVLVTSLAQPDDMQRGVDAGADAYVVKGPLERDALLAAVRRHLG